MKKMLCALALASALSLPGRTPAQTYMTSLGDLQMSSYVYTSAASSYHLDQAMSKKSRSGQGKNQSAGSKPAGKPVSLDVKVSASEVERMGQQLAAAFPQQHQGEALQMYKTLFQVYEQNYPHTLSGAATALLVGSYSAYHNAPVPDAHSLVVLKQLDEHMRQQSVAFAASSQQERKDAYIQMIMLGMQMMLSATKNQQAGSSADAAELMRQKEAGRQQLENLLRMPVQKVQISSQGLEVD